MTAEVDPRARVVVVVLDGFPVRHLVPGATPTLWELSAATRRLWDHGWAAMTAMTYSGHAALLTGATGEVNGVPMNEAVLDGRPTVLTRGHLRAETVFGALAAHRPEVRTAAVCGDEHVAQLVLTEGRAGRVWPPGGAHEGVPTNGVGDSYDDVVMEEALAVLAAHDPDLLFVHLNDTDFWGHVHGPESEAAAARRTATDGHVARLVDALSSSPRWPATMFVCLSDHDMLAVGPDARVDLAGAFSAAGLEGLTVVADGGAATVWLDDATRPGAAAVLGHARAVALAQPGVAEAWYPRPWPGLERDALVAAARPDWGCASPLLGHLLVVTDEAHAFAEAHGIALPGAHGQPAARRTLAVVAGGDDRLRPAAACAPVPDGRLPRLVDWGPTVCAFLGAPPPASSTGRVLDEVLAGGWVAAGR